MGDSTLAAGQAAAEDISFETDDFASNPEPRCPCVLLLDVSASMRGEPLQALNEGLAAFRDELAQDALACKRVEVAIVSFGPVKVELPFTAAAGFEPPALDARGDTPMGAAIVQAVELVRDRKREYRSNGVPYYRPWIFLITDGAPTDDWQAAAAAVREGEAGKAFAFFAIGVRGADMSLLGRISTREPLSLDALKFRQLFSWLSSSLQSVSRSAPGTEVALPSPRGWASV